MAPLTRSCHRVLWYFVETAVPPTTSLSSHRPPEGTLDIFPGGTDIQYIDFKISRVKVRNDISCTLFWYFVCNQLIVLLVYLISPGATIPLIHLSDEFSVRIEVVAQETNRVTSMRMFYSLPRNQIKLSVLDEGLRSDTYFYFEDNEILTFDYSVGRGKSITFFTLSGFIVVLLTIPRKNCIYLPRQIIM